MGGIRPGSLFAQKSRRIFFYAALDESSQNRYDIRENPSGKS